MRVLPVIMLCATGCAEPVITMALKLPPSTQTANVDLSCVGSIDVIARGTYRGAAPTSASDPGKPADDVATCIPVTELASFDKIRATLHDQVALTLPHTGLAGIEIFGTTGTCAHDTPSAPIFYGGGQFATGDALITVEVNPNVSCTTNTRKIRPVNLFALTASPTHQCPADIPESPKTGLDTQVLQSTLFDGPIMPFGGTNAPLRAGVVTIPSYSPVGASAACVVMAFGDGGALTAGSCLHQGPSVCAQPGEIELPVVDGFATDNLFGKSPVKEFRGIVVGAVWGIDAAGKKAPLAGATVDVDPKKGKAVYADFAPDPSITPDVNATAVKSSGLFVVYTNDFVDLTMSAPGYISETVRVSPNGASDSTVLVALKHQ